MALTWAASCERVVPAVQAEIEPFFCRMAQPPLPQEYYNIGPEQDNVTSTGHELPASMRVTPDPGNQMFGRAGFLIHGPQVVQ